MHTDTKQLLTRWQSLRQGTGFQSAASKARILWFVGLALFIFVVLAIVYKLHPALVAAAAGATGWIIAESNALQTRLTQWPILAPYIDWKRVEEDLKA